MATFDTFRPTPSTGNAPVFSTLLGRVIAWNDRRKTIDALSRLSDSQLDDIGLNRDAIDSFGAGR
jgi:uncharacterized protein YjiS (DUF1127 family)